MKRGLVYLIILFILPTCLFAQGINDNIEKGQNETGFGSGEMYSPFKKNKSDTTKTELNVPKEIRQWHIDELLGEVFMTNADTLQHLYQNWHNTDGMNGEYNYLGNMGSPRQTRIFFHRKSLPDFDFLKPYDYFITPISKFYFTDTKSPYTNLSYNESGNKITGDDRIRAYFATNAGKKLGFGFLFDYLYGRGRYDSQSTAYMNFLLYSYYKSNKYSYHLLASRYHMKLAENGGITDDEYITNPEKTEAGSKNFGSEDIPVNFSKTWNRNEYYSIFFAHNYSLGFYRERFVEKNDSSDNSETEKNLAIEPITVSKEDSLLSASFEDGKNIREYVPTTRFIHTLDINFDDRSYINYVQPNNYYADTYLPYDSIDKTKNINIKNTFAISLLEGFSKWAIAGLTAYVTSDYSRYTLPDTMPTDPTEIRSKTNEHTLKIGTILKRSKGKAFNYKLQGETAVAGDYAGAFSLEGNAHINFKLWNENIYLKTNAFIKDIKPSFYYQHYHSEHYWWDNENLDNEFRSRIEATIGIERWHTVFSIGMENVKNYTYLANQSILNASKNGYLNRISVAQENKNIRVVSATLKQDFKIGAFHLDTECTYQNSNNKSVLPLPEFNVYANMYFNFKIAKVLNTEIGADVRYFTSYYAPDYSPALGQFYQQNQQNKIEIGNYPIVNIYANFLLKQTRFYVMYHHINEGTGKMNYFLAPHYPISPKALWFGLSWNFYN